MTETERRATEEEKRDAIDERRDAEREARSTITTCYAIGRSLGRTARSFTALCDLDGVEVAQHLAALHGAAAVLRRELAAVDGLLAARMEEAERLLNTRGHGLQPHNAAYAVALLPEPPAEPSGGP